MEVLRTYELRFAAQWRPRYSFYPSLRAHKRSRTCIALQAQAPPEILAWAVWCRGATASSMAPALDPTGPPAPSSPYRQRAGRLSHSRLASMARTLGQGTRWAVTETITAPRQREARPAIADGL